MDIEKTMQFILDQQAIFAAGMEAMRQENRERDKRIDNLISVTASLALTAQAHQQSIDRLDQHWQDFLRRFDAWLRGQSGDGHTHEA